MNPSISRTTREKETDGQTLDRPKDRATVGQILISTLKNLKGPRPLSPLCLSFVRRARAKGNLGFACGQLGEAEGRWADELDRRARTVGWSPGWAVSRLAGGIVLQRAVRPLSGISLFQGGQADSRISQAGSPIHSSLETPTSRLAGLPNPGFCTRDNERWRSHSTTRATSRRSLIMKFTSSSTSTLPLTHSFAAQPTIKPSSFRMIRTTKH